MRNHRFSTSSKTNKTHFSRFIGRMLFILPLLFCFAPAWSQKDYLDYNLPFSRYIIDNWNTEDGLPSNTLLNLHRDNEGYLWAASYDGLIRFDGKEFDLFSIANTKELTTNSFEGFYEDSAKRLWVASSEGDVLCYQNGKFKTYGKNEGFKEYIQTIYFEESNQRLWIGSRGEGLFFYDFKSLKPAEHPSLMGLSINDICPDGKGGLWIGTEGKGLLHYEKGKFQEYPLDESQSELKEIRDVFIGKDKEVYLSTYSGLWEMSLGKKAKDSKLKKILTGMEVRKTAQDPTGNLWVATWRGICRISKEGKTDWLDKMNGLPDAEVRDIFLDGAGSIWIATYRGGLFRIKNGKFLNYTAKDGLASAAVSFTHQIGKDSFLLASTNGQINLLANEQMSLFPFKKKLTSSKIYSLLKDTGGNLWVASYQGLLKRTPKGEEHIFTDQNGLSHNSTRVLFEDKDKNIWVGSRAGGLMKLLPNGEIEYFNKKNNMLPSDFVMSVTQDRLGKIVVGTNTGGVAVLDGKKAMFIDAKIGLPSNLVFSVYVDSANTYWIATRNGLVRYKKGAIGVLNSKETKTPLFDIIYDGQNHLWMPFGRGIVKMNKASAEAHIDGKIPFEKLEWEILDKNDGMVSSQCMGATPGIKDDKGRLWFHTMNGATVIDPANIPKNTQAPSVYINRFKAGQEDVNTYEPDITLTADRQRFTFRFTALSYLFPKKVKFKYKLEPFDKDWIDAGIARSASYTNLSSGTYKFRVKACNNDGLWNEEGDSLAFYIQPLYYETVWFWASCLLILAGLVYALIKWRLREIEKRNSELEREIKARTAQLTLQQVELVAKARSLEEANTEISAQHEKVEEAYRNVNLLSEIGKEIAAKLSVSDIVETVYRNVSALMKTDVFLLGVYSERSKEMTIMPKVAGKNLAQYSFDVHGKNCGEARCLSNIEEILINDMSVDNAAAYRWMPDFDSGFKPLSVLYIPLTVKGNAIGIVSAQSVKANAYTNLHLDILRSISAYTAIALENADIHDKSEALLLNILPQDTADELKASGKASTQYYNKVSVIFTDFKGFSAIASTLSPQKIVENLDYCFRAFDKICKKHGIEKIKTIGDSYMAAAGIPKPDDDNPQRAVAAAMEMNAFMEKWREEKKLQGLPPWELRIGIHTGPIVAGVVGEDKFAYDIWGDTVNLASRMESNGEKGKINISGDTYRYLMQTEGADGRWRFEYRGEIQAKNIGEVEMYFVGG